MSFDNCTEAYEAGYANIPKGDPNYARKLDRDNDGLACDQPPAGFKPRKVTEKQQETHTGTKVETGNGDGTQLPKTGPGDFAALGLGLALLIVGVVTALMLRRRRVRFTA